VTARQGFGKVHYINNSSLQMSGRGDHTLLGILPRVVRATPDLESAPRAGRALVTGFSDGEGRLILFASRSWTAAIPEIGEGDFLVPDEQDDWP